ncbi:hypothetical protein CDD80_1049 [Ophiocordyceps camponoti-rufipedis]|uniref:Peroxin 20 n=1 Tax=Ophiocordyceps camponoti-rufipedis TaxID=2004952 RepID=A0A2C5ZHN4_9HYPO|nr:hypothetical protein CDD80_1049 [Ophiocordyceps camponoti-rufipedis]
MAEASCSGTTPFKRLIDHQSRDVSLHQDRVVDRVNGHASFRSPTTAPGNHGFGNFLQSGPASLAFPVVPAEAAGRLSTGIAHAAQTPDLNDWSADFRRFSAHHQHQHQQQQQQQVIATQHHHLPSHALPFQPTTFAFRPSPSFAPAPNQTKPTIESDFDRDMAKWMASHGDEAVMRDVDAAMDQFARDLERDESSLETQARLTDLDTPEIGNLSLQDAHPLLQPAPEHAPVDDGVPPRDKSAVSEAAERLLECVEHENGDKWQNSVFLSLMRDFRDGRKDIIENKIRQTADADAVIQAPT